MHLICNPITINIYHKILISHQVAMGKKKGTRRESQAQEHGGGIASEQSNEEEEDNKDCCSDQGPKNGAKNESQAQEDKGRWSEQNKEDTKSNPKGEIVLGVYLHCQACSEEVVKSLRGFDGVEIIETDSNNNKVIVKGKKANPTKVAERLRKKTGKHVDLISPRPPKDMKTDKKKETKKEEPKVVEVVLKIYLHCEGCVKDVKHCIHKMPGVYTVEADMNKSNITVMGAFEPGKLVEFVTKHVGKHASIVKTSNKDNKKENNDKGNIGDKPVNQRQYLPRDVYAPQLFSDENPHSCCIM